MEASKVIHTVCFRPGEVVESLKGTHLGEGDYWTLIRGEDVDVLKPDGSTLLKFCYLALPAVVCKDAYPALRKAARETRNRGTAAGSGSMRPIREDGSRSNTSESEPVSSGIIGAMDASPRFPVCRTTAFTRQHMDKWRTAQPFLRAVSSVFQSECPERFAVQMAVWNETPDQVKIRGTVFTTVTVNKNFQTAVHKDEGDLHKGFGVMSVLSAGNYSGGYLVFPKYRVAVDMRTRDVLLADVHEYHGNTPIVGVTGEFERVSTVLYYRSNMRFCGTPATELERAKNRRPGDRLNGR